jgi:hypothetical protein
VGSTALGTTIRSSIELSGSTWPCGARAYTSLASSGAGSAGDCRTRRHRRPFRGRERRARA